MDTKLFRRVLIIKVNNLIYWIRMIHLLLTSESGEFDEPEVIKNYDENIIITTTDSSDDVSEQIEVHEKLTKKN